MFSNILHHREWRIRMALVALLLWVGGVARAQYEALPMVILDADGKNLTDEVGRAWDPEDGVWMPSSHDLRDRTDLEVFVTNEVCADSIVAWSHEHTARNTRLIQGFVNEYRQRGWRLMRQGETYNLADVNAIAQDIYLRYGYLVDYWCRETGDTRGVYSVALVLHPMESSRFEMVVLNEKVTKYDGEEPYCPLYYKNRTVLENVNKVQRVITFRKKRNQAQSSGSWLTFDEHFNFRGPTDRRLVVERIVEACIFGEDYDRLDARLKGDAAAQQLNQQLMDHHGKALDTAYILEPMVFSGYRFQTTKQRQMRDDLMRDTMEYFRKRTQDIFDQMGSWIEYREVESDTTTYLVPRPLWKLLLRYPSFDSLRNELRQEAPELPLTVAENDTTVAYTISTRTELYHRFEEYIQRGHKMADKRAISSESELVDGYIRHINQMDIYPLRQDVQRVKIEHRQEGDTSRYRMPLKLVPYGKDTVLHFRWQMPDKNRFYQMRHVNYLQDFVHADTTHTEECDCERQMPLQFLSVSAHPADFDCPPRRHSGTDEVVTFRPRERGEVQDVSYQLSLSFDQNSTKIDLSRGNNQQQLDSLVAKAYEITHGEIENTIQRVAIVGVSSPEGHRIANRRISHGRSEAIIDKLRQFGGEDLRYARFDIVKDSVAPWSAVADLIDEIHPEFHSTAEHIREVVGDDNPENTAQQQKRLGYSNGTDPIIAEALEKLRLAQVTYAYKALRETPSEKIFNFYFSGSDASRWPSYYFYVLLRSDRLTYEEKLELAQRLLTLKASDVRRYGRDMRPKDSFGLVLPYAANLLATEAISEGNYDSSILAPFINMQYYQGNVPCYMENDPDTPVKFINLDVVLYNQILMLSGIGTPEALEEAHELVDILDNTPTISNAFHNTYRPELLELLLNSQSGRFVLDDENAEMIRNTNVCNFYVVNMAQAYQAVDGEVIDLAANSEAIDLLQQCCDSLTSLQRQMNDQPAALYFTAITEAWGSEAGLFNNRDEHYDRAVMALSKLLAKEGEPPFVERLQGDSYVRGIYRDAKALREGMDLYLEAVEQYIKLRTHEEE